MRSFKINWSGVKPKLLHYLAELLVVVFGVYLGFMANNYAAELKQKEYVNTTIKEMYQSLEEDAKDAEINKGGHLGGQKAVQYFINLSNNKAVSMDSFELYLFAVLTRSFMSIQNSSPFEAIKAKGFDVITNDSLRKNMIKLYDFQYEGLEKLEEKYQETQFYANEGNRINEILAHSVLYDDDGKFIKVNLPLRIDEKDRNRLILILKRIKFNRGFIVSYYDSIIQDIQKLRKQLEKEYPFVLQK
ncbi:MAG: hypothetical protein KA341_03455 [Saprospiraceae bacterium]|jgi:hypothetical protein|nr:hypothetical protein [Saprospiraceae bacterium]